MPLRCHQLPLRTIPWLLLPKPWLMKLKSARLVKAFSANRQMGAVEVPLVVILMVALSA